MLERADNYDEVRRRFRWRIPERYNIAVDVCDRHAAADPNYSASAQPQHEGPVAKTKRALHRMGDKMRHMGGKNARSSQRADDEYTLNRNDTRNMGAAGSDMQDSARQKRMDDAYADWKAKQK